MPVARLYIHLGLQKTGTSYLQGVMQRNVEELRAQGLDLVPRARRDAFELMLRVRGRYDPVRDPASAGTALERFADQLAGVEGPVGLLSQESLAAARPRQLRRLLAAVGEREVHVVLTARDLGRQLPSSWQQELRAGRTRDFAGYLAWLQDLERSGRGHHPWIHLDPPAVLSRWATQIPRERIHVVTVPPPGAPPTLLLERFCRVVGLDPTRLVPEVRPGNTSLGRVQAEVLRRVNQGLPDDLRRRQVYGDVGKRYFSSRVLAAQQGRPILVPDRFREWATDVADAQVVELAAAGYSLEGSLEDLRCHPAAFAAGELEPGEREVAASAVDALVAMLTERSLEVKRRRGADRVRDAAGVRGRLGRLWSRVRSPG